MELSLNLTFQCFHYFLSSPLKMRDVNPAQVQLAPELQEMELATLLRNAQTKVELLVETVLLGK